MKNTVVRIAAKLLLIPLLPLLLPSSMASQLMLKTRMLPLYIAEATAEGEHVHSSPSPVSVLTAYAEPEQTIGLLNKPFMPHHDASWNGKTDTNLVSLCGIKFSYLQKEAEGDKTQSKIEIQMDVSAFKKPENVQMTREEIIALVQKAAALNFPDSEIVILKSEP